MQVYISSGTHIDEVTERVDSINRHLDSPDIVFAEAGEATSTGQLRAIIGLFPRAPLISLGAAFLIFFAYPIGGFFLSLFSGGTKGRDKNIMNQIKNEHNAEIKEIDSAYTARPVYDNPWLWAILNWGPLLFVPLLASQRYSKFSTIYFSILILLMITLLLFMLMLYLVNSRRETEMAEVVKSHVEDVNTACIVIGEAHHWGVGERLLSHDDISVINPTPLDPDYTTLFGRKIWKLFDKI